MKTNDIATLADKLPKKPTKATIFGIVSDLCEGKELTEHDLAKLYSHFLPPIPAKAKTPFQWVARAMAKDDIRNYLQYVYSDGENTVAADGHRLHIFEGEKLKKGFYDKAGNYCGEDIGRYPEYQRVMPKDATLELFLDGAEVVAGWSYKDFNYDFGEGLPMAQKTYLDQAIRDLEDVQIFASKSHPDYGSMLITGKLSGKAVKAVVMPIRKPKKGA